MSFWMWIYLLAFFTTFLLTLLTTPCCMKLAQCTGYLDVPKSEGHKLHGKATPLLGGLAMCSAWLITVAGGWIVALLCGKTELNAFLPGLRDSAPELAVIAIGAAAAMCLGLIDDKRPLKASQKFLGQFLIALFVVLAGGIRISLFLPGSWGHVLSCGITLFWLLFLFNAINFFDNMDGLAVGTAAIAFLFFALAGVVNHQYFVASLCFCSAGAAVGFWLFNKAPAKIFMGDAGSHFLAILLGIISTKITYYNPEMASTRFAVLIPLFILAVPVFDAFAVVVIRLYHHKPIYVGDHNHISHRFMHMGMTRPQAVRMVHLLSIVCSLGALPLLWGDSRTCLLLLLQGAALLAFLSLLQYNGILAVEKLEQKQQK